MTDWSKYPINHLCSACNEEYLIPIEVNNAGATSVFTSCPHCGNREQLWIRVPWYTEVIRAYEESLASDSLRKEPWSKDQDRGKSGEFEKVKSSKKHRRRA